MNKIEKMVLSLLIAIAIIIGGWYLGGALMGEYSILPGIIGFLLIALLCMIATIIYSVFFED